MLTVSVIGERFGFAGGGGGVSPCVWSRRGPWGFAVAPPISPYTGHGWSPPICRVPLELRSVFYVLLCDIPPVFMVIIWSVSLTPAGPLRVIPIRGCSLDTCEARDWLDLMTSSSLFQDSAICADLWSRQSGPDASCNRYSVALALALGGGVMDLVYGSSSSFYMDCEVKIVCNCCRFAYIGFV